MAIALVAAVLFLTGPLQKAHGSSGTILIPQDTVYSIPGSQFNAVSFLIGSSGTLNATLSNSFGLVLYTMTPAELVYLSEKGSVSGYEWTSGPIAHQAVEYLNQAVPAGAWDFVFLNPSPTNTTVIGFWTPLTLTLS